MFAVTTSDLLTCRMTTAIYPPRPERFFGQPHYPVKGSQDRN